MKDQSAKHKVNNATAHTQKLKEDSLNTLASQTRYVLEFATKKLATSSLKSSVINVLLVDPTFNIALLAFVHFGQLTNGLAVLIEFGSRLFVKLM